MAGDSVGHAYWSKRTKGDYRRMLNGHQPLWRFVRNYIKSHAISSALEVGCGLIAPASRWVANYQAIDLNRATDAIHADFLTLDVRPWRGIELFVSCAVIEHCPDGYEQFLAQVKVIQPKHALISFFNTLDWNQNSRRVDVNGIWHNVYCETGIRSYLDALGFTYEIKRLNTKDTILLMGNGQSI